AGITVVIVGILVFKLHAFLALLLAAAVTAALTPQEALLRHELEPRAFRYNPDFLPETDDTGQKTNPNISFLRLPTDQSAAANELTDRLFVLHESLRPGRFSLLEVTDHLKIDRKS